MNIITKYNLSERVYKELDGGDVMYGLTGVSRWD